MQAAPLGRQPALPTVRKLPVTLSHNDFLFIQTSLPSGH